MKRFLLIFSLLLAYNYMQYAQEKVSPEKKVYRSEDNKLIINKDLGVYLWISTSPDPNSEKILLKSDSSKKYTNPMYFDTEGYNTIRHRSAVDPSTHQLIYPLQDVIFEVYSDGLNPMSSADYSSGSMKYLDGKKYYGGNLKIELHSADATSGIQSLFYKLNESDFIEYKESLVNFKEGENILEYYACDKVGNKESSKKDVFYIDNTPPKTEYSITGNRSDKYLSADAVIKLTSTDQISGLKAIYYKINNGAFKRYLSPIPVSVITNDETSISFYAEDNLGNKEAVRSIGGKDKSINVEGNQSSQDVLFEFYIDREPPSVSIEVDQEIYKGKYSFVSPRSIFKITADDEKSGVDKVFFSINNSLVENLYKDPFSLDKDGIHYIRVKSTDYVGNTSPLISKIYYCDINAPVTKLTIGSPKFLSHDTLFITSHTSFTLISSDDQAGVNSIMYTLDKAEPIKYSKPFNIETQGSITVGCYAADNVNNKEVLKTQNVYIDDQPPVIIYHFSVESIGTKNVRDEVYTIYPTNTMLYIAATDARSGGEKIDYSINEGLLLTENPVKAFKPGNYIVEVSAYDVLGNKSSQKIKFAIEK